MNQAPLVSVVIPTYNRLDYLKEALQSAVQQTYKAIEIIVSDNCSPNSPQSLVESFQDSRIQFWRNQTNVGMFANTMNAIKRARGKYIALLHDDDLWHPHFLEKLILPLEENPAIGIAFCDQYIIDISGTIDWQATEHNTRAYKRDRLATGVHSSFLKIGLIDKSIPLAAGAIIRRDVIDWDSIPSEVGGMYDLFTTYLCCRSGLGCYYVSEKLTYYREHDQTDTKLSGNRNAQAKILKAKAEVFCYSKFVEDEFLQELHPHFRQLCLHAYTTLAIGLIRANRASEARFYLLHVLSEEFSFRTISALLISFLQTLKQPLQAISFR